MANHQRRDSELAKRLKKSYRRSHKGQTQLLIPPLVDPQRSQDALDQVVEEWLLPTLLRDFLVERGIKPKSRFSPATEY